MNLVRKLRRRLLRLVGREYAIRLRLMRSSLSLQAIRAQRRADVLLISYPKCGRTWLTMMLARALAQHAGVEDVDYLGSDLPAETAAGVPRIRISHDDNPHWKTARRLVRSKRRYRAKKIILLVRDPRDVVVSMYFERSRRERAYSGTLHEFLHEAKGSLDTIIDYYNIWARERTQPQGFCLVRYEDLKADTLEQLKRILRFAGVEDIKDSHLQDAVQFASFENMRAMEVNDALKSGRLRARDPSDAESFKTRKGRVGGYAEYLGAEEIAWMERKIREQLDPFFGYREPAVLPAEPAAAAAGSGASHRGAP